jgi:hypothetical protein
MREKRKIIFVISTRAAEGRIGAMMTSKLYCGDWQRLPSKAQNRSNEMEKCPKCNERLVTANYDGFLSFYPDSEPYESGTREEVDFDIDEDVSIGILWCPEHGIQNLWVNEPQILLTQRAADECKCCAANAKFFKFCPDCGRLLAEPEPKPE